jgi:hypothetical protein
VWLSGYFSTRLDLGSGTFLTNIYHTSYPQCFVAKFQPNGSLLWQTGTTNLSSIYGAVLDITDGTNAIVAGTSQLGNTVWGTNTISGGLWIGRINGAGQMFGGSGGTNYATQPALDLVVDRLGSAYLVSVHGPRTIASFGNGAIPAHQETQRAIFAKWNRDGNWEWARTDGSGLTNFGSIAKAVAIDNNNSPVIIGSWYGTNRVFSSISVTNTGTGANASGTEVWVGKLQSTAPSVPRISTGLVPGGLRLSWPSASGIYKLERSPDLVQPFAPFAYTATTNAGTGQVEVLLPLANTNAFFILRQ